MRIFHDSVSSSSGGNGSKSRDKSRRDESIVRDKGGSLDKLTSSIRSRISRVRDKDGGGFIGSILSLIENRPDPVIAPIVETAQQRAAKRVGRRASVISASRSSASLGSARPSLLGS